MVDYLLVELEMGRIIQQHVEGTNDNSESENRNDRANSQGEISYTTIVRIAEENQLHDGRVYRHCLITHGLQKEHVLRSPPSHFGQGKITYANHIP